MTILTETLRLCREFAGVSPEVRGLLAARMTEESFPARAVLMRQGEPGDRLLLIVEGEVSVAVRREDGTERVLGFSRPSELVGEMALLTKEPRSASVYAETDVRALVLEAAAFEDLAREHPEVAVVLTNLIADRLGTKQVDALGDKHLAGFRIVRCVGRGANAVVYEARDEQGGRRVALKMMSHRLVYEPDGRRRFDREATILLGLDHPNIARVWRSFDAFRTRFIAMEYCDGPALATLLQHEGSLPEELARAILGQLAQAVHHLHERGVVHRDLKPGNVMFQRDGSLKLTDFGLAVPFSADDSSALEETRVLAGTPLYMAPELFAGGRPSVGADGYAFGCIAYELVAGVAPVVAANFYELVEAKQSFHLPPRDRIGRGVSGDYHALLAGALAQEPQSRRLDLAAVARWARPADAGRLAAAQAAAAQEKVRRL